MELSDRYDTFYEWVGDYLADNLEMIIEDYEKDVIEIIIEKHAGKGLLGKIIKRIVFFVGGDMH